MEHFNNNKQFVAYINYIILIPQITRDTLVLLIEIIISIYGLAKVHHNKEAVQWLLTLYQARAYNSSLQRSIRPYLYAILACLVKNGNWYNGLRDIYAHTRWTVVYHRRCKNERIEIQCSHYSEICVDPCNIYTVHVLTFLCLQLSDQVLCPQGLHYYHHHHQHVHVAA